MPVSLEKPTDVGRPLPPPVPIIILNPAACFRWHKRMADALYTVAKAAGPDRQALIQDTRRYRKLAKLYLDVINDKRGISPLNYLRPALNMLDDIRDRLLNEVF